MAKPMQNIEHHPNCSCCGKQASYQELGRRPSGFGPLKSPSLSKKSTPHITSKSPERVGSAIDRRKSLQHGTEASRETSVQDTYDKLTSGGHTAANIASEIAAAILEDAADRNMLQAKESRLEGSSKDKEALLEECCALKNALADQLYHLQLHKVHHESVHLEQSKMEIAIKDLEVGNGLEAPRTGGESRLKSKLLGLKCRKQEYIATLTTLKNDLESLKKDPRVSFTNEADVEKDVFATEIRRLQKMVHRLRTSYHKVCAENSEVVSLREKISKLTTKIKNIQITIQDRKASIEQMKEDIDKAKADAIEAQKLTSNAVRKAQELQSHSSVLQDMLLREKQEESRIHSQTSSLNEQTRMVRQANADADMAAKMAFAAATTAAGKGVNGEKGTRIAKVKQPPNTSDNDAPKSPFSSEANGDALKSSFGSEGKSDGSKSPFSSEANGDALKSSFGSEGKSDGSKSPFSSEANGDALKSSFGSEGKSDGSKSPFSSEANGDASKSSFGSKGKSDRSKSPSSSEANGDASKSSFGSKGNINLSKSPSSSKGNMDGSKSPSDSKANKVGAKIKDLEGVAGAKVKYVHEIGLAADEFLVNAPGSRPGSPEAKVHPALGSPDGDHSEYELVQDAFQKDVDDAEIRFLAEMERMEFGSPRPARVSDEKGKRLAAELEALKKSNTSTWLQNLTIQLDGQTLKPGEYMVDVNDSSTNVRITSPSKSPEALAKKKAEGEARKTREAEDAAKRAEDEARRKKEAEEATLRAKKVAEDAAKAKAEREAGQKKKLDAKLAEKAAKSGDATKDSTTGEGATTSGSGNGKFIDDKMQGAIQKNIREVLGHLETISETVQQRTTPSGTAETVAQDVLDKLNKPK